MTLYLCINRVGSRNVDIFNLRKDEFVEINEFDYVLFALESSKEIPVVNLDFIMGNTVLPFGELGHFFGEKYYYFIDPENLKHLLPTDSYFTKEQFEVFGIHTYFSKLFINELGICSPQIKTSEDLFSFNPIRIRSPKINDRNFQLIIEYLMFNNYFDERIMYKNTFHSSNSNVNNSFLESIKKLHSFSKRMVEVLWKFKHNSISNQEASYHIEEYNNSSVLDSNSLPWLIDNLTEIQRTHRTSGTYSFKKGNVGYRIDRISQPFPHANFDTYENRIILGFLDSIIAAIKDKKEEFTNRESLRTRNFSDFNDYLIFSLNNLIGFLLDKIANNFLQIHSFFDKELKVKGKIYGFPHKISGFLRNPHYKLFLEVMFFSRHLFAFKILPSKKFQLEIESFDKLYEVFCLYFLRDTIAELSGCPEPVFERNNDLNNKLGGVFGFHLDNLVLNLYYETLPEKIIQVGRANKKYHENPDFILEISNSEKKYFLIIDAKYKVYNNSKKFNTEIGPLTYKYLHRITTIDPSCEVLGLFTLSLGGANSYRFIHRSNFDLFSPSPIFPQIGGLELHPVEISDTNNPFRQILLRFIELCLVNENDIIEHS